MSLRPWFSNEVTVDGLYWKKKTRLNGTRARAGCRSAVVFVEAAAQPTTCRSLPPDCHLVSQLGGRCWQQGPARQPELSWTSDWKTGLTTGGTRRRVDLHDEATQEVERFAQRRECGDETAQLMRVCVEHGRLDDKMVSAIRTRRRGTAGQPSANISKC